MLKPYLYVDGAPGKGRGVFTQDDIVTDTIIELSPVIVMPESDRAWLDRTILHDYIFEWGADKKQCAMALGLIPIYNHSYESNCEYFMDFEDATIFVKTIRPVKAGEELTINYNGDWDDSRKVWFATEK